MRSEPTSSRIEKGNWRKSRESSRQPDRIEKLLLLTNRLPLTPDDPASPFVLDFLDALDKRGVRTSVITARMGDAKPRIKYPVHLFDWGGTGETLSELSLFSPSNWRRVRDYFGRGKEFILSHLESNRYDHLLAMWALPSGWFAYQAARRFGLDYSIWALGSDINVWARRPVSGRMIRRALRNASSLFADGDELAEKVSSLCGRDCHFLPSFHRLHQIVTPHAREHFFLYLGRLEKSKGIYDLLNAFASIRRDIWDYRLIFVGTGSQEEKLREKAKKLHLRGKVHVLGRLPGDEVVSFLVRARALVVPTHSDSIPLVFGEALQTATPLVVTDVGDLGTLVRDNKLGYVARRKSVSSLHDALVKMIVSEIDIRKQAENLIARLSPEMAARRFLEVANGD